MNSSTQPNPPSAKVRQIFTFLKALDEHRNPVTRQVRDQPWRMVLSDLPDHPNVDITYPIDEVTAEGEGRPGYILRVRRPQLTPSPEPPAVHREWVLSGWEDPFKEVNFRERITISSRLPSDLRKASEGLSEAFDDEAARVNALAAWQVARDRWAAKERPVWKAMDLFERLYGLHGTLARIGDERELVFGDGVLNWRVPSGGINHPVLLQRAELRFDPNGPEFTIVEAEAPVELYTALLRSLEGLDGEVLASLRRELEGGDLSPLQGRAATAYLRGLVARLSARGEYLETPPGSGEEDWPRVWREPTLFIRSRSLGFASAVAAVLDDLDRRQDVPAALGRVVGFEEERGREEPARERPSWSEPEEILLSREANPEQIRVAERLGRSSSVVVQGPPGTGKTHTIANLIGHLLAQGKSVLVTSHTTKALTVLREKVVEPLRPLCISVLGDDVDSRRQLEQSVNGMVERLSLADPAALESLARSLTERRSQLLREIEELRQRVIESRRGEYRPVVVGGRSLEPSEAAREIAAQRQESGWLPGPVQPGEPLPLALEEIVELYSLNERLTAEDEAELSRQFPARDGLPDPEGVVALVEHHGLASQQDRLLGAELWSRPAAEQESSALKGIIEVLRDVVVTLEAAALWWQRLVEIALGGASQLAPWWRLLEEIDFFLECAGSAAEPRYRYGPGLPDLPLEEQVETVENILSHLKVGGSLSWAKKLINPGWRRFIDGARIRNRPPSRIEHFEALRAQIIAALKGRQVAERWQRMAEPLGLPAIDDADPGLDRKLREFRGVIESALAWPGIVWRPILGTLAELGLSHERVVARDEPQFSETPEVDRVRRQLQRLLPALEARQCAARWVYLERHRRELRDAADRLRTLTKPADVTRRLAAALDPLDATGYRTAHQELERLNGLLPVQDRRSRLLGGLAIAAPRWAEEIRQRSGMNGGATPPGNPVHAWEWRQIEEELERRGQESLADLQQAIQARSDELRRVTIQLIEHRAWAAQCRRIDLETRQSLIGWQDIVRRTPKTSSVPGKLARLRRAAHQAMRRCRKAVPVWIMPLARVAESFDFAETRFDLVIIDEASQTDVMGLLVYYMADRVLVVGDHEQVSPTAVGQKEDVVQQLIREHLQGIPNADLYDGKTSIYDLARQSSEGSTCLLEHFRCAPEIIQFSNDLCYNGAIKPLRDPKSLRIVPNVIPYRVTGPFDKRRPKINPAEAEVVASLVAACAEFPEFKRLSMGVVSMVGEEQAIEIDRLLQAHLSPTDYERHGLVCGSSAQFQGDERDVMFLSLVDMPGDGPLPMREQLMFRQRFNVAASRARDQVWIIYSLDPLVDLKPGDLRRRLIEHAADPQALLRKLDRIETQTESEFERLVARRLVDRGYRVIPQYRVGYYRIDLVVEGQGHRLAVECDGDRFHPPEKLGEDMARQATLERLGLTFARVRGTQFFRDPERAMKPVLDALNRLNILPEGPAREEEKSRPESALDHELIQRIVRRAAELRRQWSGGENSDTDEEKVQPGSGKGPVGSAESTMDRAKTPSPRKVRTRQPVEEQRRPPVGVREPRDSTEDQFFPRSVPEPGKPDLEPRLAGKEDHRADLPELNGEIWLALSHWARENGRFVGWERALLHSVGKYLKNGWRITGKQAQHAQRLFAAAREDGFEAGAPGQRRESALDRGDQEHSVATNRNATWKTVDDVPPGKVKRAVLSIVPTTGEPITREFLLQGAMRKLGFQRLRRKIRTRLNRCIGGLVRAGKLATNWDRVWLEEPAKPLASEKTGQEGQHPARVGASLGEQEAPAVMDQAPPPSAFEELEGFDPSDKETALTSAE